MGYFPFFMEMEGKRGVIVGGGKVAARKVEKLLAFGPLLTVIAPQMEAGILRLAERASSRGEESVLTCKCRRVEEKDLEGAAFVVAATDDASVNERVFAYCRDHGILVNVADDREKCTFFFPALYKDGPLTVGVSTDGKSPAAAAYVRRQVEKKLPEGLGAIIETLGMLRSEVAAVSDDASVRGQILEKLFVYCLHREGEVSLAELKSLLPGMKRG